MSKAQRLTEVIRSQVEDFTAYPEEWVRFLMSPSSQSYKLRFPVLEADEVTAEYGAYGMQRRNFQELMFQKGKAQPVF